MTLSAFPDNSKLWFDRKIELNQELQFSHENCTEADSFCVAQTITAPSHCSI